MKKFFMFSLVCGSLIFASQSYSETDSQTEAEQESAPKEKQVAAKDNDGGFSPLNILFLPVKAFSKLGEHVTNTGKEGSSFVDVLGENVSQGYRSEERETNLTVIR